MNIITYTLPALCSTRFIGGYRSNFNYKQIIILLNITVSNVKVGSITIEGPNDACFKPISTIVS